MVEDVGKDFWGFGMKLRVWKRIEIVQDVG